MDKLPLNDPRWRDLNHRNWSHGKRSDSDAPFVPDELAELAKKPGDLGRFSDLWPWLCSEGTAWAAAYAAVPYAVEFAKRVQPKRRFEYLCFVGLVVICSCPDRGESFEIKPYLAKGYRRALAEALPLLAETLLARHDATETRYLLAAAAALKGHCKLAQVLDHLECTCGECPKCGESVYPDELQDALGLEV